MARNWQWLCLLALQLVVLALTTHGGNESKDNAVSTAVSVGYEKSVYKVNESQSSVQLCVVVKSPKTGMAPRPFNISASTFNGSAMAGSEYDASVNVSLEFEAGMGKRCHYIRIRDNNECGDVLIRNFSSQLFEVSSDEPLEISPASAVVEIADPECNCSEISPPENSPLKGSYRTKAQEWAYSCKDGYLLVGPTVRKCRDNVWSHESPRCNVVPSIHFEKEHVMVDMRQRHLSIPIVVTETIVRSVLVNVTTAVYNTHSEAEKAKEPHDFQVVQKLFNYSESEQLHSIVVNLNDTGTSGRTKSFILCMSVENDPVAHLDSPVANKEWAKIANPDCVSVHINNSYYSVVSLLEDSYVFTSGHQSLSFLVGFRDCDISLRLQIGNSISNVVTIPKDCGHKNTPCIVNLLDQREGVAVKGKTVGDYHATLTPHTTDCQINTKKSKLSASVSLTLSAQELHEFATTLSFSNQEYRGHVPVDSDILLNTSEVQVVLTPAPLYPFLFDITVGRRGSISSDRSVVKRVSVGPEFENLVDIDNWDEQNNSWVYNFSSSLETAVLMMQPSCDASDGLELQVVALTSPFNAVVGRPASLNISYEVAFGFKPRPNDTVSPIMVVSSRCFRGNISKIVYVSTPLGDILTLVPQNDTLVPLDNSLWTVVLPPVQPLENLTLLLNRISSAGTHFTVSVSITSYFTEMSVQFVHESYTHELPATEPVNITITATSPTLAPWTKLKATAGVIKVTANTTVDLKVLEFKDGVGWDVTVLTNQNVRLTLSINESFQEFIRVEGISSCAIHVFTNTPTKQLTTDPTTESSVLDSTTDESTFSFTPIVVVFILLLIAAVSLYVAYSRRHQIMDWVRSVGGGNADGGDHKARTRMRGRGAYKKLPTSVQDAMRRHND